MSGRIINLKHWQIAFLLIASIIAFLMIGKYPPQFFDNFGVIIFAFLSVFGVWMLNTKKETSDNLAFVVLLVGIVGLITDGGIIFS